MRYAITCNPLKDIGWSAKKCFETELPLLVEHYKEEFRW
jgi:dTDP-D-glucose 4,6-dehydratase